MSNDRLDQCIVDEAQVSRALGWVKADYSRELPAQGCEDAHDGIVWTKSSQSPAVGRDRSPHIGVFDPLTGLCGSERPVESHLSGLLWDAKQLERGAANGGKWRRLGCGQSDGLDNRSWPHSSNVLTERIAEIDLLFEVSRELVEILGVDGMNLNI